MKTRNRNMFKVGPIGSGKYDKSWDEKGHTIISNIYVSLDDERIISIQFSYIENGAQVMSKKYGSSKGQDFQILRLNHDEYVTGLSGIDWKERITSLTFHTNQRKLGPICKRYESYDHLKDRKREINVGIRDRCEFGGFFGSFCDILGCLTSIGIYVCPITIINDAILRTKFKVTEVTDDDDKQLTPYQSSDPLATTTHNLTIKYQSLEFLDGFHVTPIGQKPKLKDRIFSKLGRLFRNLLD